MDTHIKGRIISFITCIALLFLLCYSPAWAGSKDATVNISTTVIPNCTIATTPVAFGNYDPVVANATTPLTNPSGNGTVAIACAKGATPKISLGFGSNASGSTRRMGNGIDFLTYELYQPPSSTPGAACGELTKVWGTEGAAIFTAAVPTTIEAQTYNICGRIAAAQNVSVGNYSDTVTATVNF